MIEPCRMLYFWKMPSKKYLEVLLLILGAVIGKFCRAVTVDNLDQ